MKLDPTTGSFIVVEADPNAPAGTTAKLQATAGGKSAAADVRFVKAQPLTTDRAWANHWDGYPSAAMVTGWNGGCVADSILPFVLVADLGEWKGGACTTPSGRATVMTETSKPLFEDPYLWPFPPPSAKHDEIDARFTPSATAQLNLPGTAPPEFNVVKLKVWALEGVDPTDALNRAKESRLVAFARFTEARAGIFLALDPTVDEIAVSIDDCRELVPLVTGNPSLSDPSALNLYYAPSLIWSRRGKWCGHPDASSPPPRNLILLSIGNYAPNTLAHEIGHALAMNQPWDWKGHADQVKGMSSDNLMWAGVNDAVASTRWHLSLGQVFRMNFDKRSWLTEGQATPRDCGCNPYAARVCPRLGADVTPLKSGGRLPGGVCP